MISRCRYCVDGRALLGGGANNTCGVYMCTVDGKMELQSVKSGEIIDFINIYHCPVCGRKL